MTDKTSRKGLGALFGSLFRAAPPAADPAEAVRAALPALGAHAHGPGALERSAEPTVLATLDPAGLAEADLLAVAFSVEVAESTRIQLRGRDGQVIDEFTAAPGRTDTALFTPPARVSLVARSLEGRLANATLGTLDLFVFPTGAATPDKLAVVGDLSKAFDWSEAYLPPKPHDVGGRLRARRFQELTAPAPIPTVGGMQVLLEPGDELSRAVFITGYYEPESMAAISSVLPKGGVFVDVGAHCGMFTLLASSLVGPQGKVLAFEPSRREYDRLTANIALNGLTNVIASPCAVAAEAGEVQLLIAEAGHAGHNTTSKRFAYPAVKLAEAVNVPTLTLDGFFAEHGLDRCDVIKMDIEGGELPALKGAVGVLRRFRPTLVLETFEKAMAANDTSTGALTAWLSDHGYVFRDIDPRTGRIKPGWTDEPEVSKNVVAVPRR